MAAPARPRRFRSLASRMVALGVLQFALFIGTAIAFFIAQGPREAPRPRDHFAPAVVQRLEGLIDEPGALQAALDDLERERIEVSIYDAQRQLVASNVDPPLAIPERRRFKRLARPDEHTAPEGEERRLPWPPPQPLQERTSRKTRNSGPCA